MNCLEEIQCGNRVIIGIKDYSACSTPESGLWINELPGMSLKKAANVTPEQWQSGNEFIKSCIKMAVKHVFDEFATELQPYFDFNLIVQSRVINKYKTTLIPLANLERGIVVKRWRSEAARLYINEIYINVAQAGSATIKVIDGANTTEYSAVLTAGLNTVIIRYKAEQEQIKIVFNQNTFDTYDLNYSAATGCSTCGGGNPNKNIFVTGWDGVKEVNGKSFGIGVNVNVQCYEENILCYLIPKMSFLIWYKSGIVFLNEYINSDRINHATLFGKEQAKETLANYQEEYKTKYKILIKSAYNFLKSTKGECITCNQMKYVETTP
jgi:hypothetical protein